MDDPNVKYTVVRLKVDDDYTWIYVGDGEMETVFTILTDDYFDLRITQDQVISTEQYSRLEKMHAYAYGYKRALRKLSYKDHSVREIADLLAGIANLDGISAKRIIDSLGKSGLLDDEKLVINEIENDQIRLYGHHKTAADLANRGIDRELIDRYINRIDPETELQNGIQKANMIAKGIRNRSHRETLTILKNRLLSAGYPSAMIPDIISKMHLESDEETERENLNREFARARKKYGNRYSGNNLKTHIYQSLYAKGYRSEDIRELLDTLQEEDNED